MRTVFNKKSIAVESTSRKYSIPEFQAIADRAARIETDDTDTREKYLKGLEAAKEDKRKAEAAKEQAATEKELNQALDNESRAKGRIGFYERQLDGLNFTPHIDVAEYDKYIAQTDAVMDKKAAEFQSAVLKAVNEIVNAKSVLLTAAHEADRALEDLDAAANVLQSRHRYRENYFTTEDPDKLRTEYTEDPLEWRKHTHRYTGPNLLDLVKREPANESKDTLKKVLEGWYVATRILRE